MSKARTTITDIARELNISPATVSRALNNHPAISRQTREAVIALARKLNYHPNLLALSLLRKRTNTIGVIVPEITSYFFSSVIGGVQDLLTAQGMNMIIGQSNESLEEEKALVEKFTSIRVDGFLISPSRETKDYGHLQVLKDSLFPLVIFDRDCEDLEVDKVFVDEYRGAFQAVEYIIHTGCRRIAHIAGSATLSTARHRLAAYRDALKKYQLPVLDDYIIESSGFTPEAGIEPTKHLLALPEPPDAIFTVNDGVAIVNRLATHLRAGHAFGPHPDETGECRPGSLHPKSGKAFPRADYSGLIALKKHGVKQNLQQVASHKYSASTLIKSLRVYFAE